MNVTEYFKSLSLELQALENRVRHFIDDAHWLTDGEWKESVLRNIISRSCPQNISIGRGFIIGKDWVSTQMDIILYDNTHPILYKDGDLVFIQPSACRAIIEVKSSYTAEIYRNAANAISDVASKIRQSEPSQEIFVGIFFYNMTQQNSSTALNALKDLSDQDNNKTIDHVCLGKSKFIKFWEYNPLDKAANYNSWHFYSVEDKAVGYFIHNLLSFLANHNLVRNDNIWYPEEGKEYSLIERLQR